jgi:hypothetical protein
VADSLSYRSSRTRSPSIERAPEVCELARRALGATRYIRPFDVDHARNIHRINVESVLIGHRERTGERRKRNLHGSRGLIDLQTDGLALEHTEWRHRALDVMPWLLARDSLRIRPITDLWIRTHSVGVKSRAPIAALRKS